jgi:hypothetical protein
MLRHGLAFLGNDPNSEFHKKTERNKEMRILVIWEEIPEATKFYIIDIDDQKTIDKIKKAHNQIINVTKKDDDALWLGEFLDSRDQITLIEGKPINIDSVELLIYSGICL